MIVVLCDVCGARCDGRTARRVMMKDYCAAHRDEAEVHEREMDQWWHANSERWGRSSA